MSHITVDELKALAHLVRIELTEEEAQSYTEDIVKRLTYADKLSELNTTDVPPTVRGTVERDVMRQDIPSHSITQEEALANAPDQAEGHFKVPSIMD